MFEPPTITIFDTWYVIEIYHGPYSYRTHINVVLHYCKYIYVYEPPSKSIVDAWYENIYSVTVRWHIEKAEKTPSITKKTCPNAHKNPANYRWHMDFKS